MEMKDFKFESLNGDFLSKVKGGSDATIDTHASQSTDHACGSHGCGYNAGMLITRD